MAGDAGDWREQGRHRRRVADQARLLGREPLSDPVRAVAALSVVLWLGVMVWLAVSLPDRVPTHWSTSPLADGWSSKPAALALLIGLPLVTFLPIPLLSRLMLSLPDLVNAPYKDWWLGTPQRLVRFERLLREDLWLITGASLLLMAAIGLIIGQAATTPGGQADPWWMWATIVGYLAVIGLIVARMLAGRRYRPPGSLD